jgi:Flp pilus assembly protein TadB
MNPLGLVIVVATLSVAYVAATSWSIRQRALRRLYADEDAMRGVVAVDASPDSWLARWLSRAGYRGANAPGLFVAATAGSTGVGLVVGQIYRLTLLRPLVDMIANAPGSTGEVLAAILQGGPWILLVVAVLAPMMVVRTARRSRVRAIEQDLPLVLELFATMAEAGLGFDAALSKIARARGTERALISEFMNFQVDVLAGIPRVQALRQLARRVDVPSLSRFTSALIQAEQAGASMAETLQHQADDLRQRRREDALLQAQALPVKLVFPLVMCFLPGIFVSTLAPVISQMIQVANSVLRSQGR